MSDTLRTELRSIILRLRSNRNRFVVDCDFIKLLGFDGAGVVGYLINRLYFYAEKRRDKDGWFYCTGDHLYRKFGISTKVQSRIFKKLIKLEVIQTKVAGLPARRYVWIDLLRLEMLVGNLPPPSIAHLGDTGKAQMGDSIKRENTSRKKNTKLGTAPAVAEVLSKPSILTKQGTAMFFPELDQPTPISPRDRERAGRLLEALHKTGRAQTTKSPSKKWIAGFRQLRTSYPEDRIDKVLDWYTTNVGKDYVPLAFCGQSFKSKFDQLEKAMERDRKRNPDVTPSELALSITKRLRRLGWPSGTETTLPHITELCLRNYIEFRNRWESVKVARRKYAERRNAKFNEEMKAKRLHKGNKKLTVSDRLLSFLEHKTPPTPEFFVQNWLEDVVFPRMEKFPKIDYFVWSHQHPDFKPVAAGWAKEYSGSADLWNRVEELLNADSR